ncbi:hypothetical protein H6P81_014701 [Aristolochia fimbriata]|uniref:Uncharacterized protein n=1 Tax=Aristolochia fimbriata TaxID=158543 RepID=A0AAV7E4N7_ARIFI|nr:hypothetical protein H6P81_014701 [Aristolochia fimbriata]
MSSQLLSTTHLGNRGEEYDIVSSQRHYTYFWTDMVEKWVVPAVCSGIFLSCFCSHQAPHHHRSVLGAAKRRIS